MWDFINWNYINNAGTIIGMGGALIAARNAWRLRIETERRWRRDNAPITITLRSNKEIHQIAFKPKRSELTRAEVLGLIGMLPLKNGKDRFDKLKSTNSSEFMEQLASIRDSDELAECVILCEDRELEQFDCEKTPIPQPPDC